MKFKISTGKVKKLHLKTDEGRIILVLERPKNVMEFKEMMEYAFNMGYASSEADMRERAEPLMKSFGI